MIAFDVVFSEPSRHQAGGDGEGGFDLRGEDRALAAAIERAGNVVLAFFFEGASLDRLPVGRRARTRGTRSPARQASFDRTRPRRGPANILPATFDLVFGAPETFPVPDHPAVEPNLDLFAARRRLPGLHHQRARVRRVAAPGARRPLRGEIFPALPLRAVATFGRRRPEPDPRRRGLPLVRLGGGTSRSTAPAGCG